MNETTRGTRTPELLRGRLPRRASLVAAGALLLFGLAPIGAQASPPAEGEHKVTICHATASRTNPYVIITVDVASILSSKGHDGHDGPVFSPDLPKHQEWGDVIPAFHYGDAHYPGQNWTEDAPIEACGAPLE